MLDYDINLNREELAIMNNYGEYNDNLETYVDKMLRFVVSNLPNTYSIKTTRNSIKILLLSFGIMGNVLETYTSDYKDDWINNNYEDGQYVNQDIDKKYFPTPHISIGIDIKNTPIEVLENNIVVRMMDAVESIKPVNIVLDGIVGVGQDIKIPSFTVYTRFMSTNVISITKDNQMPPFKA